MGAAAETPGHHHGGKEQSRAPSSGLGPRKKRAWGFNLHRLLRSNGSNSRSSSPGKDFYRISSLAWTVLFPLPLALQPPGACCSSSLHPSIAFALRPPLELLEALQVPFTHPTTSSKDTSSRSVCTAFEMLQRRNRCARTHLPQKWAWLLNTLNCMYPTEGLSCLPP